MSVDYIKFAILKNCKNLTQGEIHGLLTILSFPTVDNYESYSTHDYVSRSISGENDEKKLQKLLEAFKTKEEQTTMKVKWKDGHYRLFLSHRSEYKNVMQDFKTKLFNIGVHAFVAHEDIEVSSEWREVLIDSLKTVDCVVAYVTDNFDENSWCSQELGYACINNLKVIPLRVESRNPTGFLSAVQAKSIIGMGSADVVNLIGKTLLSIDTKKYVQCLLSALGENANYTKTKYILELLSYNFVKLDQEEFDKLNGIYISDDQVSGYYHASSLMESIKSTSGF